MGATTDPKIEAASPNQPAEEKVVINEDDKNHERVDESASSAAEPEAEPQQEPTTPEPKTPPSVVSPEKPGEDAIALECKERGNALVKKKEYMASIEEYNTGVNRLKKLGCPPTEPLLVALQSNIALSYTRLKRYYDVIDAANEVIENNKGISKIFYRRAVAREGAALCGSPPLVSKAHDDMIRGALEDLARSLEIIDEDLRNANEAKMDSEGLKDIAQKRKAPQSSYDRLKKMFPKIAKSVAKSQSKSMNDVKTVSNGGSHIIPDLSKDNRSNDGGSPSEEEPLHKLITEQQKKDVMRLLMARQAANEKSTVTGEAFFLIDWEWWCKWCWYTGFFFPPDAGDVSKKPDLLQKANFVLDMLPQGAILPPTAPPPENDDSSSDSDSDDDGNVATLPPDAIDNSRLLFDKVADVFHRQWYDTSSLRPNLVRGYHFEILPREVYCALRSWYGEVSPNICRRSSNEGIVKIYSSRDDSKLESVSGSRCGACRAFGAKSRCRRCLSIVYCDRECQTNHWPYHKQACKAKAPEAADSQGSYEFAGRIGIRNLGNTCFMNSALQCLSHSTPLTRHFLSNKFIQDINADNPLGTGGKLAHAYQVLMKDLWMKPISSGATSPVALKRAIALFAPRFAGTLQHDAQEFLAYLLDGLHEDLNRIKKAPYVVLPDVTDGQNMAIAGAEAWDAHRRRNDSLVLDTFYGQFKSTCICPKCSRVSVSFDAFNHVSLEIPQPMRNVQIVSLFVIPCPRPDQKGKRPKRYGFLMDRSDTIGMLRKRIASASGISEDRLCFCEMFENSICSIIPDKKTVSAVHHESLMVAYEVDQLSDSIYHTVTSHTTERANQPADQRLLGFPLLVSFSIDRTCREIWNQVWDYVEYLATDTDAPYPYIDKEGKYLPTDVLRVRVVDKDGEDIAEFERNSDDEDSNAKSPFLPHQSDNKLYDILGEESAKNFLFLRLEWSDPAENEAEPLISTENFNMFDEHQSFVDAATEYKAKTANRTVSLDECFKTFTRPERLDAQNMWYCSRCKEHTRALKTMKLWRLPNVLVVHLKRFEFKHALRRDKLDTLVNFPLEGLDMKDHWSRWPATSAVPPFANTEIPALYDLFGVVNHYGRMGFGHYTAFARKWDENGVSEDWNLFDDSSVQAINGKRDVVSPAAYVLFYKRRGFN